jgi:hypothetical protein
MNIRETVALFRRHLLAVAVVLIIAAGVAYELESTPLLYSESATLEFIVAKSSVYSSINMLQIKPLIATEVMMAQTMTTPAGQDQVRKWGGAAQFSITPENMYSMQYPEYAEPSATLTATSQDPAAVRRTFTIVGRLLGQRLAALQARAKTPARQYVSVSVIGDTGPLPQPGSRTRLFGGLAVLTLVSLFMVTIFLDRRRSLRTVLAQARPGRRAGVSGA